MSKQKGNVSLRFTDTPSGRVASIIYRGPNGKQTLENLGFVNLNEPVDVERCISKLDAICDRSRALRQASLL